jgi:hypothetical protein
MYPINRRFFSRVASRFYLNASSLSLSFVLRAVKRLRAPREDDDDDTDDDDDAFSSRAAFDVVESPRFIYILLNKSAGKELFCAAKRND